MGEILLEGCSPASFLNHLYQQYPYDIEEKMVLTLLEKDPYPYPALLDFIAYYAKLSKYCLWVEDSYDKLTSLCRKMSQLYQDNKSTLHLYEFHIDAFLKIKPYKIKSPYAHLCFGEIPFLVETYLHTLPILQMKEPYIAKTIKKSDSFLFKDISIDASAYLAVSIIIRDKHGIIYVPKTQIGILIALSIVYEVSLPTTDLDFIVLYGLSSHEDTYSCYFDATNQIYIGLIAGKCFHNFMYVKQMIATLYTSICLKKQDLAISACMLTMNFHGYPFGVIMMGSDTDGKSEICDALRKLCKQRHIPCKCIFDECGILHFLDNDISATGMQIGACIAMRDLPKENLFDMLPNCAFLQHEQQMTHIVFHYTSWKETCDFHKVHAFYYISHHKQKETIQTIEQLPYAKELFYKKQHVLNDDPKQQEEIQELISQYFDIMMINDIPLGEISSSYMKKHHHLQELLDTWCTLSKQNDIVFET